MPAIRLIATDLDGTFLTQGDATHPENRAAITRCQEQGIRVCACSGRPFASMRRIVRENGFDDLCVSVNGASIVNADTGEVVYHNRFDLEVVEPLMRACLPLGCWRVDIAGQRGMYICRIDGKEGDAGHVSPEEQAHTFYFTDLDEMLAQAREDTERISLGIRTPDTIRLDIVEAACRTVTPVEVISPDLRFIEITPPNGTKAGAVAWLAKQYGCRPEQVLALGDGLNDLHMLLWAGTGVAMGNADARLKMIADMTTDTNRNAGFARAVEQIVFDQWEKE